MFSLYESFQADMVENSTSGKKFLIDWINLYHRSKDFLSAFQSVNIINHSFITLLISLFTPHFHFYFLTIGPLIIPRMFLCSFKIYFVNLIEYDLMVFHHIWNATEIKKVIPSGLSFTLLRDPVDTFESGYVYLGNRLSTFVLYFVVLTLWDLL